MSGPYVYVRDVAGVVHLADEAPLGGLVSGCDLTGEITRVDPNTSECVTMCRECLLDALTGDES